MCFWLECSHVSLCMWCWFSTTIVLLSIWHSAIKSYQGYNIITVSKPTYNPNQYVFINSDGGTGSYYGGASNGSGLLIGKGFKYNEETGFWHVYNNQTGEFGPVLCAKITNYSNLLYSKVIRLP